MEEDIKYAKMIIKELQTYGDLDGIADIRELKTVLEHLIQSYKELRQENHNLKEKLENYIPRRRVRRIYKQVKKILEQDGIVDDLESEKKYLKKERRKMILQASTTIIEFKGGDIAVGVRKDGVVGFRGIENSQEIGTEVEDGNNIFPVIFKFEKAESIDIVVKQLKKAKKILKEGEK